MISRARLGPAKYLSSPGESIGFVMHCTAAGRDDSTERGQDTFGDADAGDAPGADAPVGDEPFAGRNEALDVGRPARCGTVNVGAGVVVVGNDVRVQKEEVDALEPHAREALIEAAHNIAFDLSRGRCAEPVLCRHPDAGGQPTIEGRAHHALRLTVAVGRRHVEQRDATVNRGAHRRNAFIARGRSPELANPAAAKGERAHRPEPTKHAGFHGGLEYDGRNDDACRQFYRIGRAWQTPSVPQ